MQKVMEFEQGDGQRSGSSENQTETSADNPAQAANNKVAPTVATPRIVLSAKAKQAGVAIGVKADDSVDKNGEDEVPQTQNGEDVSVPMEETEMDDGQSLHCQEGGEGSVAKATQDETPMETDEPSGTVETKAAVPTPKITPIPTPTLPTVVRISKRAMKAVEDLKYKSGPEAHVRMESSIRVYDYEDDDEASATSAAPSADECDDVDEKSEPVIQEMTSVSTLYSCQSL